MKRIAESCQFSLEKSLHERLFLSPDENIQRKTRNLETLYLLNVASYLKISNPDFS